MVVYKISSTKPMTNASSVIAFELTPEHNPQYMSFNTNFWYLGFNGALFPIFIDENCVVQTLSMTGTADV